MLLPLKTTVVRAVQLLKACSPRDVTRGGIATYIRDVHFLKALAGIGFRDYLAHMRLKEAARLLRTTQRPIQEIACHCGFTSSNYFGDVFRSAYKVSPREYRRREEVDESRGQVQ